MRPPAEVLYRQLLTICQNWASEWDLGKHAVIGVLEEIKNDIIWESEHTLVEEDDEDDEDEESC